MKRSVLFILLCLGCFLSNAFASDSIRVVSLHSNYKINAMLPGHKSGKPGMYLAGGTLGDSPRRFFGFVDLESGEFEKIEIDTPVNHDREVVQMDAVGSSILLTQPVGLITYNTNTEESRYTHYSGHVSAIFAGSGTRYAVILQGRSGGYQLRRLDLDTRDAHFLYGGLQYSKLVADLDRKYTFLIDPNSDSYTYLRGLVNDSTLGPDRDGFTDDPSVASSFIDVSKFGMAFRPGIRNVEFVTISHDYPTLVGTEYKSAIMGFPQNGSTEEMEFGWSFESDLAMRSLAYSGNGNRLYATGTKGTPEGLVSSIFGMDTLKRMEVGRRVDIPNDEVGRVRVPALKNLQHAYHHLWVPIQMDRYTPGEISDLVLVHNDAFAVKATCGGKTATIEGSSDDDVIVVEEAGAVIHSGGGNDQVHCKKGGCIACLGTGDDEFIGSWGANVVYGGPGADTIQGGSGIDTVQGGDGNDTIYGGDTRDFLFGNSGDDIINGGAGNDTLNGGDGNDELFGGEHNDKLTGHTGDDILNGGPGYDWCNPSADEGDANNVVVNCEFGRAPAGY